jgi:DNA-binding NtrC family response regulator
VSKESILVVDDDETVLEMIKAIFSDHDYELITASSGNDALALFNSRKFSGVLCDYALPDIDGIELFKKMREKDDKFCFLMITGFPSITTAVDAMKLGATDYVTKPFNVDDLRIKVERALYTRNLENSLLTLNTRLKRMLLLLPIVFVLAIVIMLCIKG